MATVSKRRQQRTGWAIIAVAAVTPFVMLVFGIDPDVIVDAFLDR